MEFTSVKCPTSVAGLCTPFDGGYQTRRAHLIPKRQLRCCVRPDHPFPAISRERLIHDSVVGPDKFGGGQSNPRSPRAGPRPLEELRDAIDLVVVPSTWKGEQFVEEGGEPRRLFRQQDVTSFEARRLCFHAHPLVAFRHDTDRPWKPVCRIVAQILDQLQPWSGLLDQDGPCAGNPVWWDRPDFLGASIQRLAHGR